MGDAIQLGGLRRLGSEQAPTEEAISEQGRFQGQEARTAPDAVSLIQDAAEELTFSMAEVVEKKAAKRKMGEEGHMDARLVQLIQKLQKGVPDMGRPDQMQRLIDQLKAMGKATPEDILNLVREQFKDPTHQFGALECIREFLEGQAETKELAANVALAQEQLETEQGPAIRAGFNISQEAATAAKQGLADLQQLRDLYRAQVLGYDNIISSYEAIDAQLGMGHFKQTVEFLLRAISVDIEAQNPSTDPEALKQVHDDLFHVRILGNVYERMESLISLMKSEFGINLKLAAPDLMRQLFALLKMPFVSETHLLAVADQSGVRPLDARINFLREWNGRLSELPMKVYDEPDKRSKLQRAGQQALDQLIEQEEEEAW
ncbi:MAG: type III secretion system gatekeeper subunit SctW [Candidatus Hydrogenedentes bacterium]|nr:type III secretion system gatekeeper subunit SctW [Candidatus Hydrogenedentota bacterium]